MPVISARTQDIFRLVMGDVNAANELLYDIASAITVTSIQGFTGNVLLNTDNIPQGVTNRYFSNSLARAAISAIGPIAYNPVSGQISLLNFPNGSQIYTGAGVPNPALGAPGDFYLDTTTGNYYTKGMSGWTLQGNLSGPTFPDALSLELQWDLNYPNYYSVVNYTLGKVTSVDIYDSVAMTTHVFNKQYTYTGNLITKVLITRTLDGQTLEKDIVYSGNNVANVTRTYTP